jgi:hypothetical protein
MAICIKYGTTDYLLYRRTEPSTHLSRRRSKNSFDLVAHRYLMAAGTGAQSRKTKSSIFVHLPDSESGLRESINLEDETFQALTFAKALQLSGRTADVALTCPQATEPGN